MGNHVSPQGDVYSFGILLIELFTAKRPTDDMFKDGLTLQKFVENQLSDGLSATEIADASLISMETDELGERLETCLELVLGTSLSCAKTQPRERMKIKDAVTQLVHVKETLLL